MAASQNNSENQGDLSEIKRKLIRRVGVAALMIVGLLGGLALFDHLGSQTEDDAAEHVAEVQPAPRKTPTQPVTPAEIPPAPVDVEEKPPVPEASAAPVDKAAPPMDLPARPEVSAQPKLPKPHLALRCRWRAPNPPKRGAFRRQQRPCRALCAASLSPRPHRSLHHHGRLLDLPCRRGFFPIHVGPKSCMPG